MASKKNTRKSTAAGKASTIQRRLVRRVKYGKAAR